MKNFLARLSSPVIGLVILAFMLVIIAGGAVNSRRQLEQAHHLNEITRCQTRINTRFNEVLKFNSTLNKRIDNADRQDRENLNSMVREIAIGLRKNDGKRIEKAIFRFDMKRKDLDRQRKALEKARASYPPLPSEVCH